jgi:hypothetical protein
MVKLFSFVWHRGSWYPKSLISARRPRALLKYTPDMSYSALWTRLLVLDFAMGVASGLACVPPLERTRGSAHSSTS